MIIDERIIKELGNNAAYKVRLQKCSITDGVCTGCKGCNFYSPCRIKKILSPDTVEKH